MFSLKQIKYKDILNIKNLDIKTHKITCIVGESGSGKSTLLKLLNNLISSDSGEIYYDDKPLRNINAINLRRNVVMLPQYPSVFSGSIKDNLLIGLKFSEKQPVSDDKLYEVLKLVYLDKELNKDAYSLSGGEKQRLALARIILLDPDVLLLDEPSSALDENTEYSLMNNLIKYIKENNKTLIMVTHSRKIANNFADEIIEIEKGTVINQGVA